MLWRGHVYEAAVPEVDESFLGVAVYAPHPRCNAVSQHVDGVIAEKGGRYFSRRKLTQPFPPLPASLSSGDFVPGMPALHVIQEITFFPAICSLLAFINLKMPL